MAHGPGGRPELHLDLGRDNPTREDVAESFLPYLAVRYRRDRLDATASAIEQTIPNRIAYFDAQGFAVGPFAR